MRLRLNPAPFVPMANATRSMSRSSMGSELAILAGGSAVGAIAGALLGRSRTSTGVGAGLGLGIAVALIVTAEGDG